jgi:acyl-CoA thioesterase FadM
MVPSAETGLSLLGRRHDARAVLNVRVGTDDATDSIGARALRDDGYRYVAAIDPPSTAFDGQGHLNNSAISRIFNDLRVEYMITTHPELGADLGTAGFVVAVREAHVSFESQGLPGERFVGGIRIEGRRGRAQIVEQRLVEASTGRPIAREWSVQLLTRDGAVVDWPADYWTMVAELEGRPMPPYSRAGDRGFGPPPRDLR